ncbi:PD40 domain-containing protein [Flavobacterium sp. J27]|uniref:PD40 domain-containing protein n=1 Tax=Flavobacterium sp. J27 TaxID=2060419 RepID=UPI001030A122|nr:PD40 domain-containing protein [Flavobacterium sp. J27]
MKKIFFWVVLLVFTKEFSQNKQVIPAFDFLINYSNCRDFTLSKNQDEMYFTVQNMNEEISRIVFSKKVKNKWTKPNLVSFSSNFRDLEPFLSQDGLRLYFASNRPLQDTISTSKDYDIWYVERKSVSGNWSKPINIGAPVNTEKDEFYPSVALNGNLYFTSENKNSLGKDDIFVSYWNTNKYSNPENLGTTINSSGYEFNAFIDPEEKFLIFTGYKREDGLGSGDLYISYQDTNGKWQTAKSLGETINSVAMDYCPFYDTNNNILYFTSRRNNTSNKNFQTLADFEQEINQYENGCSRIYKCYLKL